MIWTTGSKATCWARISNHAASGMMQLREFCVIESCIVMHCGADWATGAPQTFFDNNKVQFSDLTTNQAVGSSNLSGRAILQGLESCR